MMKVEHRYSYPNDSTKIKIADIIHNDDGTVKKINYNYSTGEYISYICIYDKDGELVKLISYCLNDANRGLIHSELTLKGDYIVKEIIYNPDGSIKSEENFDDE